ncbi:/ atpF / F-type ATPase subunit b /:129446 Forward [Candidatus Hepatoplasma crinochetorum]|uniref:ATP synthase subunit b n=1 Tax=Candidatus Hepatoplasma crinochetorum TaxID=295596 RepID=A0A0G7ZM56_9MOLU|nr:/ atpF / F-type ATPase subunit b /:129446 Forward [Candidatus Hepatoplasma crinochetorum]
MDFGWKILIEALATIISLGIIFFIISYFLYFPIKDSIKKREKFLSDRYTDANKINADALKTQNAIEARLKNSKDEADKIVDSSKKEAIELKNQIVEDANSKAKNTIDHAREQIKNEEVEMYEKVKNDISSISILVAKKILEKEVNAKIDQKLIDDLIKTIQNEK